jgi:CDP-glucose 4,6-dehydratase
MKSQDFPGTIKSQLIDREFFLGKRVLITGHTGFKGSWLSLILSDLGAEVAGFALPPKKLSHFNLISLERKMINEFGDIRDKAHLNKFFSDFKPEIVFHLAAQAIVTESYEDPIETFETNILGSANLLETVRNNETIRSLVFITSDKCYENKEWIWGYRENDRLGGLDPYSASKASAEFIFSSYCNSFFRSNPNLGAASARAGNVIGGGDWSTGRVIPDCVRSIESQTAVKIRNPKSTRPWQHVLEPISGYLRLSTELFNKKIENFGAWNFGPDKLGVSSVQEVVNLFHSKIGLGEMTITSKSENFYESELLQLNCDKAYSKLGWRPHWDTEKAITETAAWFDVYLKKQSIIDISRKQIGEYFEF